MAKKIFLSGLKGGSGKTTLAIHFSNFVFFHMKRSIILVNFDFQNQLSFLGKNSPYPVIEGDISTYKSTQSLLSKISRFDIAVFDIPGGLNPLFINFHKYADLITVPFEYTELDFFKVFGLIELLNRSMVLNSNKNLLLIPNRQDRHINLEMKLQFSKQPAQVEAQQFLPAISLSNLLRIVTFSALNKAIFYLLRPTCLQILRLIDALEVIK